MARARMYCCILKIWLVLSCEKGVDDRDGALGVKERRERVCLSSRTENWWWYR